MKIVVAAAALAAFGAAAPAFAQDATSDASRLGIYGTLGWQGTDSNNTMTHSIQGRVGGRFARYLGVEGELGVGLNTDHQTFTAGSPPVSANVGVKRTLNGAGYVVGFLPLGSNFDLLARVGYGASRFNISPAGSSSFHATENGIRYGAGAQYFFDGKNGIRGDYTREHYGNLHADGGSFPGGTNANVWSVAFAHKF
jgi:outer membrane immunogenic protein